MEDYLVEFFNENKNSNNINNRLSEFEIYFIDKYFFNNVNDSKNKSLKLIEKFDLINSNNSKLSFPSQSGKNKNNISLSDYYALPFLILQKFLDSIDGKVCIIGRLKINTEIW